MSNARLPAHLEVAAIRRLAESHGGNATILAKGNYEAGTIAIVIIGRERRSELLERIPQRDGNRIFEPTLLEDIEKPEEFLARISRRQQNDPDLWLIEVQVSNPERFVAALPR